MENIELKKELEFENEEIEPIRESTTGELAKIVSYNIANTVEVLKFKIDNEEIDLQPEFQRDFVWDINRASLFIDSLLIGLPIPSIFLGKSKEDETYKVIDGQQRLKSVYFYMKGKFITNGQELIFGLRKLENRDWNGKTYDELDEKYKRRIRNAVLNTTIIEDIDSNPRLVHDIFHRLNTGGMSLTDQEVRNCVYNGTLNNKLIDLNKNKDWRQLLGKTYPDRRLRDVEMVLRFYALFDSLNSYKPSMREFLSNFQDKNKKVDIEERLFEEVVKILNSNIGVQAFRVISTVNKSVCDAVMVSIAQIIKEGKDIKDLENNHKRLVKDEEFIRYVTSGTSAETSVKNRITIARNYFLGLR
ncbi:MAG: DUF262 domain-containing protein [Bacteroidetes bacterium]|nr:DUF262 domain-containing protein [Bacteroidota bacterium]